MPPRVLSTMSTRFGMVGSGRGASLVSFSSLADFALVSFLPWAGVSGVRLSAKPRKASAATAQGRSRRQRAPTDDVRDIPFLPLLSGDASREVCVQVRGIHHLRPACAGLSNGFQTSRCAVRLSPGLDVSNTIKVPNLPPKSWG